MTDPRVEGIAHGLFIKWLVRIEGAGEVSYQLKDGRNIPHEIAQALTEYGDTRFQEGKTVGSREAVEVMCEAEKHLIHWLEAHECDCEGGHICGRKEINETLKRLSDYTTLSLLHPSPVPPAISSGVGGEVKFPPNCPVCKAPLDWTNDETDIVGCRICGGGMCWNCGSVPEGICNKCGEKMAEKSTHPKENMADTKPTKEGE